MNLCHPNGATRTERTYAGGSVLPAGAPLSVHQRDRCVRAERIYTSGVVILGSVALLVVCAPLFLRIVLQAGGLHAGQVALIWLGAAFTLAVLWLALPLRSTVDGMTLSALLYPPAVLLVAASLMVPFALTWCWFGSRARRP